MQPPRKTTFEKLKKQLFATETEQSLHWFHFLRKNWANQLLKEVKRLFNDNDMGIDSVGVTITADQNAWRFGLTFEQLNHVYQEHHQSQTQVNINPELTMRQEQLNFLDYYIRSRNSKNHPSQYREKIEEIQELNQRQRVFFHDDFLPAYKARRHREHLRLGSQPIRGKTYNRSQLGLAPELADSTYRQLSRYRIVCGPIPYDLDGFGKETTRINTVTACAINLMGSSRQDLQQFTPQKRLNTELYKQETQKIVGFLLKTIKSLGATRLVMPAFGLGVYIKTLSDEDKRTAKEIMADTFANLAKEFDIVVTWVVWQNKKEREFLEGTIPHDNHYVQYVDGDLIHVAATHNSPTTYMLNPGSDRTIGGAYCSVLPHTLEEKIAQISRLLILHSELNRPMMECFASDLARACSNTPRIENNGRQENPNPPKKAHFGAGNAHTNSNRQKTERLEQDLAQKNVGKPDQKVLLSRYVGFLHGITRHHVKEVKKILTDMNSGTIDVLKAVEKIKPSNLKGHMAQLKVDLRNAELGQARALLVRYINALSHKFFNTRNHVRIITEIIQTIDRDEIKDVAQLKTVLRDPYNQACNSTSQIKANGSLARCIAEINKIDPQPVTETAAAANPGCGLCVMPPIKGLK